MIKRWIESDLVSALHSRRGVHLTGARQSGKTTLASMLDLSRIKRRSLDDDSLAMMARTSPSDFVRRSAGETLVIDEIQKVPELLNAIKICVDEDNSRAQYLLTGSSNLRFTKTIKDSLAGRFATVRLRTLALAELNGKRPSFLESAFKGEFSAEETDIGKADILHHAFIGGYPEQLNLSPKERRRWYRGYLNDLLTKDIKDVTEIRKIDILMDIAEWLLARTAQFFTLDELCTKMGISLPTAENYLNALRSLYVFDRIPAWSKSEYDRIGKKPKWIVSDTGLAANILRWDESDFMLDPRSGKFIESWIYHEIACQAEASGDYEIKHYRDRHGREIDFLIEDEKGDLLGVEVKAGSAVGHGDFKHLKWFAANLARKKFTGIVVYTGKYVMKLGDNMFAVPMGLLT